MYSVSRKGDAILPAHTVCPCVWQVSNRCASNRRPRRAGWSSSTHAHAHAVIFTHANAPTQVVVIIGQLVPQLVAVPCPILFFSLPGSYAILKIGLFFHTIGITYIAFLLTSASLLCVCLCLSVREGCELRFLVFTTTTTTTLFACVGTVLVRCCMKPKMGVKTSPGTIFMHMCSVARKYSDTHTQREREREALP